MNQPRFTLTIVCLLLSFSIGHTRLAQSQGVIGVDQILWIRGGHAGGVSNVAFSPDGTLAASLDSYPDSSVKIWRVADRQLIRTISPGNIITSNISFFPDGQKLAIAMGAGIRLYRISDGALVRIIDPMFSDPRSSTAKIAVSPDGESIAFAAGPFFGNVSLGLATVDSGIVQWMQSMAPLANPATACLSFSSDGMTIFTGNGSAGQFLSWNATDGTLLRTLTTNSGAAFSCAVSPNGQWWGFGIFGELNGTRGGVKIVSTATEGSINLTSPFDPPLEEPGATRSVVFSPDNSTVAYSLTPSGFDGPSPIFLKRVPDADFIGKIGAHESSNDLPYQTAVLSLAFSPDGSMVASGAQDQTFHFWQVSDHPNPPVFTAPGHAGALFSATYSPNGMFIVSGGEDFTQHGFAREGAIKLWSPTGDLLRTLFTGSSVNSVVFSPDSSIIASGTDQTPNGSIRLWRASDGSLINSFTYTGRVSELAYSPDERMIASSSDDALVRLWSVPDGNEIRTLGPHLGAYEIAFSPDGEFVATAGSQILLWRISDGSLVQSFPTFAKSIAFTPDGQNIVSAGTLAGQPPYVVALWRISDGALIRTYQAQSDNTIYGASFSSVAVSPDGRTVAAADGDRAGMPGSVFLIWPAAIQFWRLSDGEPLGFIDKEMGIGLASISFSPDGASLCFGRRDGTVGLLRVPMVCLAADEVTNRVSLRRSGFRYNRITRRYVQTVTIRNISGSPIQGPVSLVVDNLSPNAFLHNATDFTACADPIGSPFINVNVGSDGLLIPGESRSVVLQFDNPTNQGISYTSRVLAGSGER